MKALTRILILLFVSPVFLFAQNSTSNDTVNKVDANGKKQGYWKKYSNDTLKYEGHFKDDIPTGLFTYYYSEGKIKAKTEYSQNGKFCSTLIYNENGKVKAEGFYYDKKKDSLWIYYGDNDTISAEEHYNKGLWVGVWKSYYSDGILNEEKTWVNDTLEGPWKQYYSDGSIKLAGTYKKNKLEGIYKFYYPEPAGQVYYSGVYKKSLRDGVWMRFSEKGVGTTKEIYKDGVLLETIDLTAKEKDQK